MATEDAVPEHDDVRRKALLRLGVAAMVTAAALAGLWWLDQGSRKPPPAPRGEAVTAPIVPAPPAEAPPPQAEPPAPAEGSAPAPAEPPPPPRVGAPASPPPPSPGAQRQPAVVPAPAAAPVTPVPATPPAAVPSLPAAAPAGRGYVVQLGVFSNPDNARELVERLAKQGIRAQLEARVQVGPFRNRQEAEQAQAEMRRLGYSPLIMPASPAK